jgi:hypothetical protein
MRLPLSAAWKRAFRGVNCQFQGEMVDFHASWEHFDLVGGYFEEGVVSLYDEDCLIDSHLHGAGNPILVFLLDQSE